MFVLLVMIHFLFYFNAVILPILWVIMLLAGLTAQGGLRSICTHLCARNGPTQPTQAHSR